MTAASPTYAPVDHAQPRPRDEYTADQAIEAMQMGRFQYLLILLTGLCWTAESMEMLLLSFIKLPLQCAWGISDARAALITTSVGVGMLAGATAWGMLSDRLGRRPIFIASTALTFVMGLVSAASLNYPMLVISRGLVGFGIGGIPVSYALLMEFLPAASRGSWGMSISFFWSAGAIFEAALAMLVLPTLGWRSLIALSSLPLLLVLLASFFVPESPRWLVACSRLQDAQKVLGRVAVINNTQLPPGELVARPAPAAAVSDLVQPGVRTLAAKVALVWFVCAFVYYGIIMLQPELIALEASGRRCAYPPDAAVCAPLTKQPDCTAKSGCVWSPPTTTNATSSDTPACIAEPEARVTVRESEAQQKIKARACATQLTRTDFLATLWASVGEFPGILLSLALVDILGRRSVIAADFGICAVMCVLLLGCLGRAVETIAFFLLRGASSGAFQATYLFTNELYPAAIRGTAMGISSSVARLGLIITPAVAQVVVNRSVPAGLWTYFGVSFSAVLAVLLIPIETKARPLQDSMDELVQSLRDARAARKLRGAPAEQPISPIVDEPAVPEASARV